jgi:hypothetical protein
MPQAAIPERAPFVDYSKRFVRQKRFLQRRSTDFTGKDQRRQITTAKKARCKVECFAVHKHFYGD